MPRGARSCSGANYKLQSVNHCLTFAIFSIDSPQDLVRAPISPQLAAYG